MAKMATIMRAYISLAAQLSNTMIATDTTLAKLMKIASCILTESLDAPNVGLKVFDKFSKWKTKDMAMNTEADKNRPDKPSDERRVEVT